MACRCILTGPTGVSASVWAQIEQPGVDWPTIAGWLEAAAKRTPDPAEVMGPQDVLFVARRFVGMEPVAIAAATVGWFDGDVEVIFAGGDKAGALPIFNLICRFAKDHGAKAVRAEGREGWSKILPLPVERKTRRRTFYRLEL